jgi:methylthioribose-1-phosphate isomerase
MPSSTIDASISSGADIPIEERPSEEIARGRLGAVAPEGVEAWNPAFDVTPAELITGWITEAGLVCPPYDRPSSTKPLTRANPDG